MTDSTVCDVKHLSFESAIDELEAIMKRLEKGDREMEGARVIRARGEALRRHCMELIVAIPGC